MPKPVGVSRASSNTPIEMFQVFGERRSGTNYVAAILSQNTSLKEVHRFGWKHGLPLYPVLPASCVFVVVLRAPVDWLKALYRAPFEVDPALKDLEFPAFIRAEWESVYTPKKSRWRGHGYDLDYNLGRGEVLQLDRHPIEGRRYKNVVELRNVKLAGHLSMLTRGVNCVVVRYEEVNQDPDHLMSAIRDTFGVQVREKTLALEKRVGPSSPRQAATTDLSVADLNFIKEQLDTAQELRCGYRL